MMNERNLPTRYEDPQSEYGETTSLQIETTNPTLSPSAHSEYDSQDERMQKQEPRRLQSQVHVLKSWKWELAAVLVTLGLFTAIVAILLNFQHRTLPEWPLAINLNTLIALLATIMRTVMLVPVAEVIGQMKWSWFATGRPLSHLSVFDKASRGVMGSIRLLAVAPLHLMAVVASIIMMLSLAIGPFTQQAVRSVDCQRASSDQNSSTTVAHLMNISSDFVPSYRLGPSEYGLPYDMKGAMVNGLVNPTGNDSAISAVCKSGNCTWQADSQNVTYSSIGMCSKCIDTTPLVVASNGSNEDNTWTLPNGLTVVLVAAGPILNTQTDYDLSWASSVRTKDFDRYALQGISNVTVLSFTRASCVNQSDTFTCPHNITAYQEPDSGEWDYVATTCTIYPCLRSYHGNVDQGIFSEEIVSTELASFSWGWEDTNADEHTSYDPSWEEPAANSYTALKSPCTIDGTEYTMESNYTDVPRTSTRVFSGVRVNGTWYYAPVDCQYSLSTYYALGMYDFMSQNLFKGDCVWSSQSKLDTLDQPDCEELWWLSPLYNARYASLETISAAMDDFATAVTNKFRTSGTSYYDTLQQEFVLGIVNETTVCTMFEPKWLLLPAILALGTALLLIAMILKTKQEASQPVWKSSVLPLLFYGLELSATEQRQTLDLQQMDEQAAEMRARFTSTSAGEAGFVDGRGPLRREMDMDSLMEEDVGSDVRGCSV